jgi:hypothetical protein
MRICSQMSTRTRPHSTTWGGTSYRTLRIERDATIRAVIGRTAGVGLLIHWLQVRVRAVELRFSLPLLAKQPNWPDEQASMCGQPVAMLFAGRVPHDMSRYVMP